MFANIEKKERDMPNKEAFLAFVWDFTQYLKEYYIKRREAEDRAAKKCHPPLHSSLLTGFW